MRTAVCRRYGPPDVVRVEDRPGPRPRDDEILVRLIGGRYPLERIAEAHARVDAGRNKGHFVVTMA
jgi:NADPH:quinone reductase-like Zn-dependent oxidoreductase